jgi:hypothetical protein
VPIGLPLVLRCETRKALPRPVGTYLLVINLRHRGKAPPFCVAATGWRDGPEMGGFDKMAILNEF